MLVCSEKPAPCIQFACLRFCHYKTLLRVLSLHQRFKPVSVTWKVAPHFPLQSLGMKPERLGSTEFTSRHWSLDSSGSATDRLFGQRSESICASISAYAKGNNNTTVSLHSVRVKCNINTGPGTRQRLVSRWLRRGRCSVTTGGTDKDRLSVGSRSLNTQMGVVLIGFASQPLLGPQRESGHVSTSGSTNAKLHSPLTRGGAAVLRTFGGSQDKANSCSLLLQFIVFC